MRPLARLYGALAGLACVLSLLLSLRGSAAAQAEPFEVSRLRGSLQLQRYVRVLEDESRALTLADVRNSAHAARFVAAPASMTFGFNESALWLRLTVVNSGAREQRWLLQAAHPLLDYVTLYVVRPDGGVEVRETGDMRPFSTRDVKTNDFAFELASAPHSELTCYLRVQTSGSLRVPFVAWEQTSDYFDLQIRHNLILWTFYGALAVMVMFNFGVYLMVRQREYLAYTLLLVALWAVQFTLVGHSAQFLLPDHPLLANKLLPVAIAAAILLIPIFALEAFAQFGEFTAARRVALRCLPYTSALLLFAAGAPMALALRGTLCAALLAAAAAPFLLHALRKQDNPQFRLYFLSWYCVAAALPIYVLRVVNVLPPLLVADWSIQIGITLHGVITAVALADRLKVARDQLGVLNAQLSSNVTDLKRALGRAEQATEEARHAMQVKSEFMATMSHELRTPLNTIINVPQGLLQDFPHDEVLGCVHCQSMFELEPGDQVSSGTACPECGKLQSFEVKTLARYTGRPERTAHYLAMIERSGKHLLHMVNGILDFSKMEAGRLSLTLERFDAGKLIQEVVDEMGPYAERAGVQLAIERLPLAASLTADPVRIKQVLMNLLSNAVKFSERGSVVSVGGEGVPEGYHFFVKDRGIGIAAEHFERIFESFEQVHKGNTRNYGGTGLGLSISRSLVRMHGGEMWVASELGKGSTFFFRIPSARPNLQPVTGVRELSRELPELNPNEELAS